MKDRGSGAAEVMGQPGDEGRPVGCEPVLLAGGLGMLFGCIWSFLVPDTSLTGALL